MKTKQLLLILLAAVLPSAVWANVWQDPVTKVNYEYDLGDTYAWVKHGTNLKAGSPDAKGAVEILSSFIVDGIEYSVIGIDHWAFFKNEKITSIIIPEGFFRFMKKPLAAVVIYMKYIYHQLLRLS